MVHRNPYQHVFPAFIFTRSCSLQPFPLVLWLPYGRKKRAVSVAAIDAIWGDGRPDHVYSINYQYQLRHRSLSPARNLPKTLVPLHVRPGEAYHLLPSRGFGLSTWGTRRQPIGDLPPHINIRWSPPPEAGSHPFLYHSRHCGSPGDALRGLYLSHVIVRGLVSFGSPGRLFAEWSVKARTGATAVCNMVNPPIRVFHTSRVCKNLSVGGWSSFASSELVFADKVEHDARRTPPLPTFHVFKDSMCGRVAHFCLSSVRIR